MVQARQALYRAFLRGVFEVNVPELPVEALQIRQCQRIKKPFADLVGALGRRLQPLSQDELAEPRLRPVTVFVRFGALGRYASGASEFGWAAF